jgi:hypothetical protein
MEYSKCRSRCYRFRLSAFKKNKKSITNNHAEHSPLSPRSSSNSLLNIIFESGRKAVQRTAFKISLLVNNPAKTFLIIFIFGTFVFREKHGLVRNDFLDCMMELRQASKDEAQGDVQSTENGNSGAKFSKLQHNIRLVETGY